MTALELRPYQEEDFSWLLSGFLLKKSGREGATNTRPALNIKPVVEAVMSDRPDTWNPTTSQDIISRAEARSRGLTRYFTGKPCKRGHVAERSVSSFGCLVCKNQLQKEYSARNPGAVSEANKRHYYANHERMLVRAAAFAKAHPEKNRENARAQYRKNPAKFAVYSRNRKARKKAAEGHHAAAEITALYQRQRGRCANCKASLKPGYHADHIIPLSRGGSNWITNIQLLCPPCNLSKKALDPLAWARREGRLL